MRLIRIATRNSPLAMWQANYVKDQLLDIHNDLKVEIVSMTTRGDQLLDRSLSKVGGKGLFLKELEVSLMNNETDIAVHSMKDVPVELPEGLTIPVVCSREDARDAFVSNQYQNLYALPAGAKVGTSSLRRVSQLKHAFPKCEFLELRGNVNTRLKKLDDGEFDAIILATAGLKRLGLDDRIRQYINPKTCLPAVGQGIIGIECREDDQEAQAIIAPLHDRVSQICLLAERAMNETLEGGCQVPVAGFAQLENGKLTLEGLVATEDGETILSSNKACVKNTPEGARKLGKDVADHLIEQGAGEILKKYQTESQNIDSFSEAIKQDLVSQQHQIPIVDDNLSIVPDKDLVLLTRQARYLGNMPNILKRLDYQPVHIPTIKIDVRVRDDVIDQLQYLHTFTDVVFVSRNAVEIGMPLINEYGGLPNSIRALAVGTETAKQLHHYGVDALYPDIGSGAEALLQVSQLSDLTDRKVLIVRGDNSLAWPEQKMRDRGAEVKKLVVYYQTIPEVCAPRLNTVFDSGNKIACVFAHSPQSVLNLINSSGSRIEQLVNSKLVAGSEQIATAARKNGWKGDIKVAESPANKQMMLTFSG